MKWEVAEASDSNLMRHALRELALIGYGPYTTDPMNLMMQESLLEAIYNFSKQGHSGSSGEYFRQVFNRLLAFENLSEITNNPGDWQEVGHDMWQSRRNSKLFSADGGKHYWDVNDNQRRMHTAEEYTGGRQSEE